MPAPNLCAPANVVGKTLGKELTTTLTPLLINSMASGVVYRVVAVYVVNKLVPPVGSGSESGSGSNANSDVNIANLTAEMFSILGSATVKIARDLLVYPGEPATVLVTKDKPLYLNEGDELSFKSDILNSLDVIISYEEIS